jgi:arylsulfatase A-like enzyme
MYGDFAMMVDSMIGQVLKALEQAEMSDNTLVVFSSDNGPVWYESDVERLGHDSSGGLRGMKADAWECGHRMPFIARWPGKIKALSTSKQMICFTDLLATFAELTGATLDDDAGPDSVSFLPALTGQQSESDPIRKHMVIRSGGPLMTIRQGDWKLINGIGSSGFSKPKKVTPGPGEPKGQLYNLAKDLGETNNLYNEQPELVDQLQRKLNEIRTSERSR